MGMRRKGREVTLQVLYSLDFLNSDNEIDTYQALNDYHSKLCDICAEENIKASSALFEFTEELVKNTLINLDDIDDLIKEQSISWDFDRIAQIDKNILRMSTYEIVYKRIHPAIVINEAIEISKKYSTESSSKFINGILDSVFKKAQKSFEEEQTTED